MLRVIATAKKKNDRIDASKIADCLRCGFLSECYMASTEIRERRRTLRYRSPLARQAVQLKNKIAGASLALVYFDCDGLLGLVGRQPTEQHMLDLCHFLIHIERFARPGTRHPGHLRALLRVCDQVRNGISYVVR